MPSSGQDTLERYVDFGGFRCCFRRSGLRRDGGLPIFFLAGAFQAMGSWRKFAAHFEPKTQVLLADLPGTGGADLLPRHYRLDFLADAACALMDAAGIEHAYVVSASYGSPIAYRMAQRHPDRVKRMVLAGVMHEFPAALRQSTEASLAHVQAGRMHDFATCVVAGLLCGDEGKPIEKRRLAARLLGAQLLRMEPADRARYVENTRRLLDHTPLDLAHPPRVPTLVFTGEHDVFTRPEYCREISRALPLALFTTIERADHLFHIERFDVTLALVDAFYEHDHLPPIAGSHPFEAPSVSTHFMRPPLP